MKRNRQVFNLDREQQLEFVVFREEFNKRPQEKSEKKKSMVKDKAIDYGRIERNKQFLDEIDIILRTKTAHELFAMYPRDRVAFLQCLTIAEQKRVNELIDNLFR
jgi:hypothetical protein